MNAAQTDVGKRTDSQARDLKRLTYTAFGFKLLTFRCLTHINVSATIIPLVYPGYLELGSASHCVTPQSA